MYCSTQIIVFGNGNNLNAQCVITWLYKMMIDGQWIYCSYARRDARRHARRVIKVNKSTNGYSKTETLNDKQQKKCLLKAIWFRLLFRLSSGHWGPVSNIHLLFWFTELIEFGNLVVAHRWQHCNGNCVWGGRVIIASFTLERNWPTSKLWSHSLKWYIPFLPHLKRKPYYSVHNNKLCTLGWLV